MIMLVGKLKLEARNQWVRLLRLLGSRVLDARSGRDLGRALLLPWRGQILVLAAESPLVPLPVGEHRMRYWKQGIGFTVHEPPDFYFPSPSANVSDPVSAPKVLLVLLDHRPSGMVQKTLELWGLVGFKEEQTLLLHGGSAKDFSNLNLANAVFLPDARLRTSDPQRDHQSYRSVFKTVANHPLFSSATHILFHEFDHVPLVSDLALRLLGRMSAESCDMLAYHASRVDGSINAHWLSCMDAQPYDDVALSILGTGHFWKKGAWQAVANDDSLEKWYLELEIPTIAHKNRFRVRGLQDQEQYVMNIPERLPCSISHARANGAWTMHPVKTSDAMSEAAKLFENPTSPINKPQ